MFDSFPSEPLFHHGDGLLLPLLNLIGVHLKVTLDNIFVVRHYAPLLWAFLLVGLMVSIGFIFLILP